MSSQNLNQVSQSLAQVQYIHGKNRITRMISSQPVKWLSPSESNNYASLYLSGYGGGMVQGDHIEIDLYLGENTKLALTTQSYTKAFKSEIKTSKQTMSVHLEPDSCIVFLPDPLIPQKNSAFTSNQNWYINRSSRLITVDWFNAGRMTMNEKFSFRELNTDLKIECKDEPIIWDRFSFLPNQLPSHFPSVFGEEKMVLNGVICALNSPKEIEQFKDLLIQQLDLKPIGSSFIKTKTLHGNIEILQPGVLSLRFLAENTKSLEPILKCLTQIASHDSWLGQAPFQRKF